MVFSPCPQVFSALAPSKQDGLSRGSSDPLFGSDVIPLDDRGIAITMSAFRVGAHNGGDGESMLQIDTRNAAGFVRHPNAFVTNWLLPMRSLSMTNRYSCPRVEESKQLLRHLR